MDHQAETALAGATLKLSMDRPYLSAALWAMRRIETIDVPTMAVDAGWRLYYNPEKVLTWSAGEVAGVLYHEVCHLLRDHAGRGNGAGFSDENQYRWNIACDAEINDGLAEENDVSLPEGAVYPAAFDLPAGLLAEEYYHRLPNPPSPTGHDGDDASGNEGGSAPVCRCRCGSGATGGPAEPWEIAGGNDRGGVSDSEATLLRRTVAISVREHSATRGTVPGHWLRWAEKALEPPKVDWRKELAAAVRRSLADALGATDYRYCRPSRRQSACPNIVLPSLRQPTPCVAVVVDTSGSVSDTMLRDALSELSGILRSAGQREGVTILSVDAAVQSCQKVFRVDQVRSAGGGGTDMGVGLAAAVELRPRPEVVVVITDGFTPWPAVAPHGMRIVVALTDARGAVPTWAKLVPLYESNVTATGAGRHM